MSGAVPLIPLYPSMAWTGKTLPFIIVWLKFNITTGIKFFDTMYIVGLKKYRQCIY